MKPEPFTMAHAKALRLRLESGWSVLVDGNEQSVPVKRSRRTGKDLRKPPKNVRDLPSVETLYRMFGPAPTTQPVAVEESRAAP